MKKDRVVRVFSHEPFQERSHDTDFIPLGEELENTFEVSLQLSCPGLKDLEDGFQPCKIHLLSENGDQPADLLKAPLQKQIPLFIS